MKVTGTKQNPAQYLIDGSWYVAGTKADMNSVKSGDTVDAYTINGVVFYAKRTSGENASLSDVAIVLAVGSDIQGDKAKILSWMAPPPPPRSSISTMLRAAVTLRRVLSSRALFTSTPSRAANTASRI